ncbi:GNAT family N-acetyltransferase [Streptomyces alkaliterrae]|uniref:GNAT family N-acetyltransferase n=1 Tax=Streptomyces alkaliterrae TaxID=2213162 RepID=A0A5P0YPR8_9ACTN|nr:GNAT family N-acetyltransferase [Streptomyces alkaliterrae]MBB1252681.1 GNAT family N-acetyltransferase [Streptomyces alkaliterrae]MBB1258020.1 GNAT family N-acetyltransferase [Streptomyces alkaliterrae]MQS01422.1 GNAT family N-acetyltransferase [Streptomyces alkaliterrae]
MTAPPVASVERLDGPATARAEAAFRQVYAETFAEPPYRETPETIAGAFSDFTEQTRAPGFRSALAATGGLRAADPEPVGIAFGRSLAADDAWWDRLLQPAPADLAHEDGRRTFALLELAVRAPWRGRGVARRLHETLLADVPAERVLLNVRTDADPARAAYAAWGYRPVGAIRGDDGARYTMMLLPLT